LVDASARAQELKQSLQYVVVAQQTEPIAHNGVLATGSTHFVALAPDLHVHRILSSELVREPVRAVHGTSSLVAQESTVRSRHNHSAQVWRLAAWHTWSHSRMQHKV
jgi:hypothetical protein